MKKNWVKINKTSNFETLSTNLKHVKTKKIILYFNIIKKTENIPEKPK